MSRAWLDPCPVLAEAFAEIGDFADDALVASARASARPRVVARWRMTANGIARSDRREESVLWALLDVGDEPLTRIPPGTAPHALTPLLDRLHESGVRETVLEGDPDLIAAALDLGLVDDVVCWIDPVMALQPDALATGGIGAATVDEGWRLVDVSCTVEGGLVKIEGRVKRR